MGKKYIIELLDDCPSEFKGIIVFGLTPTGQISAEPIPVEELTPYTEPDLEQVRKEAYEQGYYIGYSKYLNKSFEDGIKGSWEAARKIICEMDYEDHMKIFGGDNLDYIFALSPTTVIEKLKAYEQEKEKQIQVGDEVIATSGKAVIVSINDDKDKARYIYHDSTLGFDKVCNLSKTGRHFPEIAAVLEKMRGEQG